MKVTRGIPQGNYPNGSSMCTTAAHIMCTEFLCRDWHDSEGVVLTRVMKEANTLYGGEGIGCAPGILRTEYVICECGSIDVMESGWDGTGFFITLEDLPRVLETTDSNVCSAVLTCGGHSFAVCAQHGRYSYFDSSPSCLTTDMSRVQFMQEMQRIMTVQCDVTVYSNA